MVIWDLLNELLSALPFMLIDLEILALTFTRDFFYAGLLAIPAILLARWVSVAAPVTVMRRWRKFTPGTVTIMTWAGLRGGVVAARRPRTRNRAGRDQPRGHLLHSGQAPEPQTRRAWFGEILKDSSSLSASESAKFAIGLLFCSA